MDAVEGEKAERMSTIEENLEGGGGGAARRRRRRRVEGDEEEVAVASIEREFDGKPVPTWREQLTVRAFAVSMLLGVMFSVIVMKLNLTTGVIPSLNVSAGLLGFFFVKTWTAALARAGLLRRPFTRQENTVIQTCVVATSGIAFSGIPPWQSSSFSFSFLYTFIHKWWRNSFFLSNMVKLSYYC